VISVSSVASPLVSIIIPAFNYERYVARAIESALAQDYPSVEVVVVDDGSTDGTAAVAKTFEARGVTVVSQENQGLAAARNTGIRHSKGDLLFFLDADDYLELGAIARLQQVLARLEPEFGMVACLPNVIEVRDGVEHSVALPNDTAIPQQEVTWRQLVFGTRFPCTVLAKRQVFDVCGLFDQAYHRLGCEDRDMWLRVAEHYRVQMINERLVNLLFHGTNMSGDPKRQLAGMRRCLDKAKLQSVPIPDSWFWRRAEASYEFGACLLWESVGAKKTAMKHLVRSVLIYPFLFPRMELKRPVLFRVRKLISLMRRRLLSRVKR
jgi:glycosyltransferase involved in cell wall biosynthesis